MRRCCSALASELVSNLPALLLEFPAGPPWKKHGATHAVAWAVAAAFWWLLDRLWGCRLATYRSAVGLLDRLWGCMLATYMSFWGLLDHLWGCMLATYSPKGGQETPISTCRLPTYSTRGGPAIPKKTCKLPTYRLLCVYPVFIPFLYHLYPFGFVFIPS